MSQADIDPVVYLSINAEAQRVPLSEARVPVLDRGFIFGDGVYEAAPFYLHEGARRPFRLPQHLARLDRSLKKLDIPNPHDEAGWRALIDALLADNADGLGDAHAKVYLQITRGVAKRGHAFPVDIVPTVFMMVSPMELPGNEIRTTGVRCVTAEDRAGCTPTSRPPRCSATC